MHTIRGFCSCSYILEIRAPGADRGLQRSFRLPRLKRTCQVDLRVAVCFSYHMILLIQSFTREMLIIRAPSGAALDPTTYCQAGRSQGVPRMALRLHTINDRRQYVMKILTSNASGCDQQPSSCMQYPSTCHRYKQTPSFRSGAGARQYMAKSTFLGIKTICFGCGVFGSTKYSH